MPHCHKDVCAWYNTAHYIKYPVFKYLMWKTQVTLEHLNREKCGKFTFAILSLIFLEVLKLYTGISCLFTYKYKKVYSVGHLKKKKKKM